MKAMLYHEYGSPDNLTFGELEMPVSKDDQILVKVHAASLNWLDWHFLAGNPFMVRFMAGLLKPKYPVLGIDFAGRVESIGTAITQFQPGDQVFGSTSHGCFAEYVCVFETQAVHKPVNISFAQAAAVPGAAIPALQALRDLARVQPGQKVLINGASGGLGIFAVQLAKYYGADVTGVCSARNLEMVKEIGANQVIDYTQEDFTQNGQYYDLIFDAVAKCSFAACQTSLRPGGIYITTQFSPLLALAAKFKSIAGGKKYLPLPPKAPSQQELIFLKELLENANVKPVIDSTYLLSEVPVALRHLETGHVRGKLVIKVE